MKIIRKLTIEKSVEKTWDVLGNQFADIDKWASLISKSEVSGDSKIPGVSFSIRSTETKGGPTKQELTSFNSDQHTLSYKAISGTPFFFKSVKAKWSLSSASENTTNLVLDFEVLFKGIGGLLSPVVKKKLGNVGDQLLEEFKYFVENEKPHPRKLDARN
jgi:hypothetical protein